MSILCMLGGHEASPTEIYNAGYYFSRCRRCGEDMMRWGAAWHLVPRGHRIVWKAGSHHHSIEADYGLHLPILHRESNLPAVKPRWASWDRRLVRSRRRAAAAAAPGGAGATAERDEHQYPYLLALAALVGAGLQLVLTLGGGRG